MQVNGDYVESWQPQPMSPVALQSVARNRRLRSSTELGGRGIFGVELFVKGDDVWFSEVSPRPHDTGMVTMCTQAQSEFELHARAILGLPVDTRLTAAAGASAVIYGGVDAHGIRYEDVDKALARTQQRPAPVRQARVVSRSAAWACARDRRLHRTRRARGRRNAPAACGRRPVRAMSAAASGEVDLVVQGPSATIADARAIALLVAGDRHRADRRRATRLRSACAIRDRATASRTAAAARRLDCAFVPRDRRLVDVRVVAMDMDSTLITIECIDEIADMLGHQAAGRADHRERDARRDRFPRRACSGASRCCRDCRSSALQRVYDERLRLSPGAERMLERLPCRRRAEPARFRRLHVLHRSAQGSRSDSTSHALERPRDRRRQADRSRGWRHRRCRREGARAARSAGCAAAPGSPLRSATARTICRCFARPTSRSPIARSRSCARKPRTRSTSAGWMRVTSTFRVVRPAAVGRTPRRSRPPAPQRHPTRARCPYNRPDE